MGDMSSESVLPAAEIPMPVESRLRRTLRWLENAGENYRLTRFVLLRFLGLVWFVAFLSAAQQFIPLVGHDGLLPADLFVERVVSRFGSPWAVFWEAPSLFWFRCDDAMILAVTWTGVMISALVMCGFANSLMLLVLWALYFSLLPIGQEWFQYGWDIQILETGFLGVMLCPLLDPRPFPRRAPPILIVWLYRWLIWRIMMGAGLIKLRSDSCWTDLTALYYHYETQPIPNPLARWLHFAPKWFHQAGVLTNHFVELVVPWFGFYGRWARHISGVLMVGFMGVLIITGNLSFLNWLTIIPALACFDDSFWRKVLPRKWLGCADASAAEHVGCSRVHLIVTLLFSGIVLWLSIAPVKNLFFTDQQAMNGSFDKLHLVNTYGAFGSIDRERFELVFEGTQDSIPEMLADWREYEFKAKPTDPMRRPVVITPYHYRLDWAAWFPWSKVPGRNDWLPHFLWKLLHNDPGTLSLLAGNPFPDAPPKWLRVSVYRYKFAPPGQADGAWWTREHVGTHVRPVSLESANLRQPIENAGWLRE
jgi:hypothetical protein